MTPATKSNIETAKHDSWSWAMTLPAYAKHTQNYSNWSAIAAALLGSLTGLSVWTLLESSPELLAQIGVTVAAVTTAGLGSVPKIMQFEKRALTSTMLTYEYNRILRELKAADDLVKDGDPEKAKEGHSLADKAYAAFEKAEATRLTELHILPPEPKKKTKTLTMRRQQGQGSARPLHAPRHPRHPSGSGNI